jgi:hypothetical protein
VCLVVVLPKTKRAKDRIAQHGKVMKVVREAQGAWGDIVLVKSLRKTDKGGHWLGWFPADHIQRG